MWKLRGCGLSLLAVCLVAVSQAHGVAADEKPDTKALDVALRRTLYDIINYGALTYNRGDVGECYRIYQNALLTASLVLTHHPKIQKSINEGLAEAAKLPTLDERAFKLRELLDKVRNDLRGGAPPSPAVPPSPAQKKTAWDRLGGEKGVATIVDDFVASAAKDPKVNFDRNGKYKLDEAAVAKLKNDLVAQISSLTGGPLKYNGDLKKMTQDLQITNAEFDAAVGHLKTALENHLKTSADSKALMADVNRLLVKIEDLRTEIVAPKKTDDGPKKPDDKSKKPDETLKKPEDKAKATEVHGKVTVNGAPLAAGKISYIGEDNKPITAEIKDGAYQLPELKLGSYKITVEGDKINERYKLLETTPLKYKIAKEEKDSVDWELKP